MKHTAGSRVARAMQLVTLVALAGACASGGRPNVGLNDERLVQRFDADINLVVEAAQLALEGTALQVHEVRQQRTGMWQIVAETQPFGMDRVRILCAESTGGAVEVRILGQRAWSRTYRRNWAYRIFGRMENELARMQQG